MFGFGWDVGVIGVNRDVIYGYVYGIGRLVGGFECVFGGVWGVSGGVWCGVDGS